MPDIIIIGAGAAGLSAALWCDELGLQAVVLEAEDEIGGQLRRVYNRIENHLGGVSANNGLELRDRIAAQIENCGFELKFGAKVSAADLAAKTVVLESGEKLSARALILATGVRRRKLGIAGENEFIGRGIIESGKRDRERAAGKRVCIIGGGDAAAENALILAEVAEKVFLVHRRSEFRARTEFLRQIENNPRIEILTETQILQINGKTQVESIELQKTDSPEIRQINVEVVLIRIGVEPNTDLFCDQLETDAHGYIVVDGFCRTNAENIFAVGDVAHPLAPTVSTAVGTGAIAAKVLQDLL